MLSKITTFAIIMKTPIPDKNQPKEILLKKGYAIKHYDIRRMVGYSKDGKRLENKEAQKNYQVGIRKDMFKLKGKYCEVDFSHEHPVIFHGFRTATQNLQYNLAENLTEVRSVINMLNQFANYDVSPCELLISLDVKGRQNSDMTFLNMQKISSKEFSIKDWSDILAKQKEIESKIPSEKLIRSPSPSAAEHLEVRYHGDIDWISDNIESIIRARNGKYVITLRFNSTGTKSALENLARCEEFSLKIIKKLESISKLD